MSNMYRDLRKELSMEKQNNILFRGVFQDQAIQARCHTLVLSAIIFVHALWVCRQVVIVG